MIKPAFSEPVIYPLAGHWVWNPGGWLSKLGMMDFAGSAVVHSVGGWAALAALGAFMLWFGWFGFNPGSSLSGLDLNIARIAVTTNLAAAAGGTVSTLYTMWKWGKPDASMIINGSLAGLVAITCRLCLRLPGQCGYYRRYRRIFSSAGCTVL